MKTRQLILASSSSTRKLLLDRLQLDYIAISPDIDETAKDHETAEQLAQRLSFEKAYTIAKQYPDAVVIGSDQVAWLEEKPSQFIGKPYTQDAAIQQLQLQSGKVLNFSTGLSVQCLSENMQHNSVVPFRVKFRTLSADAIDRYVMLDQPLHCAGSFKCEGLGMSLFEWLNGEDYTALMGLPIIQLCQILRLYHFQLP